MGKANFTEAMERLLESMERYCNLENRIVAQIRELLLQRGIRISGESIPNMDKESIRERLLETRNRRIREEQEEGGREEKRCEKRNHSR